MAITFAYTESTNTIVVTGGTGGTPATFADFVTADRAGMDTDLLVAGSPASDLALTYAIRPVEDLAILVKCIVANKTAEADFIFITGKDWRGVAQTESIDVAAGNGSYTTTKYWSEITTLDCSDNAAGGGTVWADGDLSITQDVWGVIWDYGNGQYYLTANFNIGNGSTSTYFRTIRELISVSNSAGQEINSKTNSTFQMGSKDSIDGFNEYGSVIRMGYNTSYEYKTWQFDGICKWYVSAWMFDEQNLYNNPNLKLTHADSVVEDCTFLNIIGLRNGNAGIEFTRCSLFSCAFPLFSCNGIFTDILIDGAVPGNWVGALLWENISTDITIINITIKNIPSVSWHIRAVNQTNYDFNLIDSTLEDWTDVVWQGDNRNSYIYRKNTVNIHVIDKDGTNLSGATVKWDYTSQGEAFSVSTAANGTITEQTIIDRRYYSNPGNAAPRTHTEEAYYPHKLTISKAGYETLILDAITVDGPINWHLELQAQKQPPAPWQEGMM